MVVVKNAVVVVKNVVVVVKNGEAHFFDSPRFVAENEVFFRRGRRRRVRGEGGVVRELLAA